MKIKITDRVAIFQTDTILGMSKDQYGHRAHQVTPLGGGLYRVTGPNVKFQRGEVVELHDASSPPPEMKSEAVKLGLRFGAGIGAKTLGDLIKMQEGIIADLAAKSGAAAKAMKASRIAARAKAAKARK